MKFSTKTSRNVSSLSTAVCDGKPIVLLIDETGASNRKAKLRISGH